jgi:predicted transposase YdaD
VSKPFDATLNSLIDARPEDWVAYLAPRLRLVPGPAEVLDTDLSATVQADKVFRLHGPPSTLIHLELEANPRLGIPADLLRYNVLIGLLRKEDVHTVILLLRPKANPSDLTGVYERSRLRFKYSVVRLWEESVDAILAAGPTLAPLALLTNEAATKLDETFDRFAVRLKQADVDSKLARELFGSTFVLCGLRYEPERIAEMYRRISMTTLEDSTTYQWILKQGEAKGVAQGRSQEARQLVSKLANKKFGTFADGDAVLHRIDDAARLERMAERIFDAKDWDDLLSTP